MSDNNSSIQKPSTISALNCEHIDSLLRAPFNITKELFSSPELNLEKFVCDVNQFIQEDQTYKETISKILGVFSIVRPKQQELLSKIESAISITHSSNDRAFENIFSENKLPFIFKFDSVTFPIFEYIRNDDFENFQKFVTNQVDFDFDQNIGIEREYYQTTYVNLLDIAAYYGSIQCFKYLVANKAPFSKHVCQYSICGGNYEIIHYIENNYEKHNFDTKACLAMSVAYHRYELMDYILPNLSAKKEHVQTAINTYNFSAFSLFIMNKKLLSDDLLCDACFSGNLPIIKYLCEVQKASTEVGDEDGKTPLQIACLNGHLEIVQYLCEVQKVNPEERDGEANTPLIAACSAGYLSIVQYLCEVHKADVEATEYQGWTPLIAACCHVKPNVAKYLPIIKYLCEVQKANAGAKDDIGKTALHYACQSENLPIVQYLCEVQKVNPEEKDQYEETPLFDACEHGQLQVVKYLCEVQKVNAEAKNKFGFTPLHIACSSILCDLPVAQYLCEVQKVNAEEMTTGGYPSGTPLHLACWYGRLPFVKYLCEVQKVNKETTNDKGVTPYSYAKSKNNQEIINYLESIGVHN